LGTFVTVLINSLWFIFPAYVANSSPVIIGGGIPMDLGRNFIDNRRLLGNGKTFRGFFGGILAGMLIGAFQGIIYPFTSLNDPTNNFTTNAYIIRAFFLSFGALTGDLVGSFLKRRINLKRGAPFPIMDQIGFLVFAFLFVVYRFTVPLEYIILLLPLTLFVHLGANIVAYLAGLKSVWY